MTVPMKNVSEGRRKDLASAQHDSHRIPRENLFKGRRALLVFAPVEKRAAPPLRSSTPSRTRFSTDY